MRILCFAVLAALSTAPIPASAQQSSPSQSYAIEISGHVPPIVRFGYSPATETSGTLTVDICNTPTCDIVVELVDPTDQNVMVSFDNGPPISVSRDGSTIVFRSTTGIMNASYPISVENGRINVQVVGR